MSICTSRWLRAIRTGFIIVAATTAAAAFAAEEEAPSPEVRADIERLMELTGASNPELMEQMGSMIGQQIAQTIGAEEPEAAQRCAEIAVKIAFETVSGMFSDGDFMDAMNTIYAKYFSQEEIRQMIAFYETPVGRKSIEVMPELMSESMQVTMQWLAKVNPVIQERVTAQLREEGLIE